MRSKNTEENMSSKASYEKLSATYSVTIKFMGMKMDDIVKNIIDKHAKHPINPWISVNLGIIIKMGFLNKK